MVFQCRCAISKEPIFRIFRGEEAAYSHCASNTTYQSSGRQNWVASSPSAPRNDANFRHCERSEAIQNIHLLNAKWYKNEKYYGFKGNVLINSEGTITDITTTAANIDERDSLWDVAKEIEGMIIADKGLIGKEYQDELRQYTGLNFTNCRSFQYARASSSEIH